MNGRLECQGCRRPLKHPTPSGYGPVCAQRRGLTPTKPRRAARARVARQLALTARILDQPPPPVLPGQTAIDLDYHQPTLEAI
jgi:hypothetical protein